MKIESYIDKTAHPDRLKKRFIDISRAVNGNIEFGNPTNGAININGVWISVTTPGVADTEFIFTHNLNRIPTGVLVVSVDKAAVIYASQKNLWTNTQIRLKCNVATVSFQGFII